MSDQSDQFQVCPHCGQENAIHSLKCIRCGEMLEDLFVIEGLDDKIEPESAKEELASETMSVVLASLEEHPLLNDANADQRIRLHLKKAKQLRTQSRMRLKTCRIGWSACANGRGKRKPEAN